MTHDLNSSEEVSPSTILLTGELRRRLRIYALRRGISVSEIARTALRNFLDKHEDRGER